MVEWIVHFGMDEIQARLMAKYGTNLNVNVVAQQPGVKKFGAMRRASAVSRQVDFHDVRLRLVAFYHLHDPTKIGQVESYVEWIEQNGVDKFNALLVKKYGVDLNARGQQIPPPPPFPPAPFPPPPPLQQQATHSYASQEFYEQQVHQLQLQQKDQPRPAATSWLPVLKTPKPDPTLVSDLKRFYKMHGEDEDEVMDVARWAAVVGMERLNEKLLQLFGASLATLNGSSPSNSASAPPQRPQTTMPLKPTPPPVSSGFASSNAASHSALKQRAERPVRGTRRPSEGACDDYVLDMTGDSFGVCLCGFPRAAHSSHGGGKASSGGGVVNSSKVGGNKQSPTATATAMATAPATTTTTNSVEVWFDAATTAVFKKLVSSYAEQHGGREPDKDMQLEWATNLHSLSSKSANGSDGGAKLRVKALKQMTPRR